MDGLVRRTPELTRWDPFGIMEAMSQLEPFAGWEPFGMARSLLSPSREALAFTARFDVKESENAYVFTADVPGIKDEDLDVSVTGNRITISGRREAEAKEEKERYYSVERSYGSFTRSFTLPEGVDLEHIQADLKNGVLTLVVPKREVAKPRKISLKGLRQKVSEKLQA